MDSYNTLIEAIKTSKNVVIISHVGPDGDTLGSMLGLREILSQLDSFEKIDTVVIGKIPDLYRFLPNINLAKNPDDKSLYQNYDLAITVDCAAQERFCEALDLFRSAKITVNIDHHISNPRFAKINFIDPAAAASGQIIYNLARMLEIEITKDIATCLYTSILTDTGGFKFENTRPETFYICAELVNAGANPVHIYQQCYESKSMAMVRLHARAIDKAIFIDNDSIAYTLISRKLLESLNSSDDHVDGISESLRQINTVEIALVFKETQKGMTKVSFRSKKTDICEIARHFGGGGHKLAAGCTIEKSPEDSVNEILPIVRNCLSKTIRLRS